MRYSLSTSELNSRREEQINDSHRHRRHRRRRRRHRRRCCFVGCSADFFCVKKDRGVMIMEGKLSPDEFQTEAFEDEDLLQQGGISLIKILDALLLIELMSQPVTCEKETYCQPNELILGVQIIRRRVKFKRRFRSEKSLSVLYAGI